jgi:hypothetical protein
MASANSEQSTEKSQPVMLVAIDESDHSAYALKWTLDHFFSTNNHVFKLVLVHARPAATSSVGLAGPGIILNFILITKFFFFLLMF